RFLVVAGLVAFGDVEARLAQPFGLLLFQRANLLLIPAQLVGVAIESFVAMAAHAAAQTEDFASGVECVGHLGYDFARVALLASGFGVLFGVHRPEPVLVIAVRFLHVVHCHAVPAVTGSAAEAFGIVNLQQFLVWMAGKGR